MIERLREETKELHDKIEGDNLAGGIMDHQISLEQYKALLLQNYLAYYIVENSISPFYTSSSNRLERLERDLDNLGLEASSVVAEYSNSFTCENRIEALGAAYVVEGSALGGMYIAGEIQNCKNLRSVEEHNFFNADRHNVKPWNEFLKKMRSEEFTKDEEDIACEKAKETFRFFGSIMSLKNTAVHS